MGVTQTAASFQVEALTENGAVVGSQNLRGLCAVAAVAQ